MRNRLKLAGLVVLLTIPVAWLMAHFLGGFISEALAVPFLYLGWIARVYVRTVPRPLFWGGLVLFGVALAATNVVIAVGRDGDHEPEPDPNLRAGYADTIKQLTSQIRFARRSLYFRRSLAKRLGRLILRSRGDDDQFRPIEIQRALSDLEAPPAVQRFFSDDGENLVAPSHPAGWLTRLRAHWRSHQRGHAPPDDLEDVIRFLEDRLEVS